jgi:hypothetical protein
MRAGAVLQGPTRYHLVRSGGPKNGSGRRIEPASFVSELFRPPEPCLCPVAPLAVSVDGRALSSGNCSIATRAASVRSFNRFILLTARPVTVKYRPWEWISTDALQFVRFTVT